MRHELLGKVVTAVELSGDNESIQFRLNDGSAIVGTTWGDCCSHTWIEDVIAPEAAIGEILSVQELELPRELRLPTRTDNFEDVIRFYGLAIKTSSGTCTIAYRNSSNGYYGGDIVFNHRDVPRESFTLLAGSL